MTTASTAATKQPRDEINAWAPTLNSAPDPAIRLFCFPYAGAGPIIFRPWMNAIPPTVEMRVLQLPGRGPRLREAHVTEMRQLIDTLEHVLDPLFDRPTLFFGHSLGALVAFELARRLEKRGTPPVHLFISANVAPHVADPNPPIHQLPPDGFLQELRHLNGMPAAVLACADLLEIMLPVVRSDFALLETYRHEPGAPLSCPVTVFGGTHDPRTTPAGLDAWRQQTTGDFDLLIVPGDHFFIDTSRPHILAAVGRALDAALREPARPRMSPG